MGSGFSGKGFEFGCCGFCGGGCMDTDEARVVFKKEGVVSGGVVVFI